MSKYPVGPKLKSLGTFVKNVPTPPPLWLFYLLNGAALLVFCVLLIGLQFDNTTIIAQQTVEQALFVLHFFFLAIAVIWSIATNRRISRYLCIVNSGGITLVSIMLTFEDPGLYVLVPAVLASLAGSWLVLYLPQSSTEYYAVLSGDLDVSQYQPYSLKTWKAADLFGTIMGYVGELFILFLAIFMVLRFIFHD